VFGRRFTPYWMPWALTGATAVALALAVVALWEFQPWSSSSNPAVAVAKAADKGSHAAAPDRGAIGDATSGDVHRVSGAGLTAADAGAPDAQGSAKPTATVKDLLATHSGATDTDSAFGTLFGLWGMQYVKGGVDPCTQASKQGLECLVQKGSFGQLRLYNRPAILMLSDDAGGSHQVVLRRLDDDRAHLELGGTQTDVSIADLSRYWLGDFVMLWHPPTAQQVKALALGMKGDEVRWLRDSLQRVQGTHPDGPVSDVFDADLSKLVRDFQRDHRLVVDGIAGVQTQIVLATAVASPDSPLLYVANTHGT
jgi:general secretion pathway protein A